MNKLSVILLSIIVYGCQTGNIHDQNVPNGNTSVVINVDACYDNVDKGTSVCLDSVTEDSRCPTGLVCVWAGDAVANFSIKTGIKTTLFKLHSNERFQNDTILQGYRIKLLSISPYPSNGSQINQKDYSAEISVTKE